MRSVLGIHGPSTVIKCSGRYYVFGTGQGIISSSSVDQEILGCQAERVQQPALVDGLKSGG